MAHRKVFKLCAGGATVVFTVTSGLTGMEMHPLSAHPESEVILAMEMGIDSQSMASMPAGHSAHHAGHHGAHQHSMPGSSNDCSCLGPCQGGAPPTLTGHMSVLPLLRGTLRIRVASVPESPIHRDPTAYLRPLPNAPPLA